ncbi:hypothetical protein RCL_jg20445.t1 [Rhizophagus clarus]|uniref:Uncharacterized protein n=1 Tax=Rhizophagus clarus TaxID=94130 RepID=A0A8H3KWF0_9GLOM|nr:hypothetical protein RCL_jg20445.t1 [Rhizophagus clarus]
MSDNASQSNYEYNNDTHITRTVYNDGKIIFNEENLDLPPIILSTPNMQTFSTNISLLQRTAQNFGFDTNDILIMDNSSHSLNKHNQNHLFRSFTNIDDEHN